MDHKCAGTMQKTHAEYVEQVNAVHGDSVSVIGEYQTSKIKIEHECIKGHRWKVIPNDILRGVGCPQCSSSKGEKRIADELNKLGIEYKHDRTFPWSQRKRYDFIIKSKRVLIEYDGIQHFRPVDYSSNNKALAEKQFRHTQLNDDLKNRLAKENGYRLIRLNCDENGLVPSDLEHQLRSELVGS